MASSEIFVYWADGTVQTYSIEKPTTSVGRAPGNDIVLPTSGVSRYHAHLNKDGDRISFVDLGTVNGTFLNDELMAPEVEVELKNGEEIKIGDVRLVYRFSEVIVVDPDTDSTVEMEYKRGDTQPLGMPTGLVVKLDQPHQRVAPGARLQLGLVIENSTDVLGLYDVEFSGKAHEWAKANRREIRLKGHEQTEVIISVRPPRMFDTEPGMYDLEVMVSPRGDPGQAVTETRQVEVVNYHGLGMIVQEGERGNQFDVIVQNQGNTHADIELDGWHAEDALKYEFDEGHLRLEPGETRQVGLTVKPRRGGNVSEPTTFAVVARSQGASGYQAPVAAVYSGGGGGGGLPVLLSNALIPIVFLVVVVGIGMLVATFFLFGPDEDGQGGVTDEPQIAQSPGAAQSEELDEQQVPVATNTAQPTELPAPTATLVEVAETATSDEANAVATDEASSVVGTNEQGYRTTQDEKGHFIIEIPPGTFMMGTQDDRAGNQNERPAHQVTFIEEFWIDQYEVANGQYLRCVEEEICTPPGLDYSQRLGSEVAWFGNENFADYPVLFVTWEQASAYCGWRAGRLPSEAEWEYAARGEDGRIYPWGSDSPNFSQANFGSISGPIKVGSKAAGVSPFGVHDMAGNAWEWVADWYDENYYDDSPAVDPPGPEEPVDANGKQRVIRGGSWFNTSDQMRAANRHNLPPDAVNQDFSVGFRCVLPQPVAP